MATTRTIKAPLLGPVDLDADCQNHDRYGRNLDCRARTSGGDVRSVKPR